MRLLRACPTLTPVSATANVREFRDRLRNFHPVPHQQSRVLALYSAAIAVGDEPGLDAAVSLGRRCRLGRDLLYEVVLQSYLFLGFPRMLLAAERLHQRLPATEGHSQLKQIHPEESAAWFSDGVRLCQRVYGDNYQLLKERVESFAPEVFRWMVIEGYGKVLSRPGLDPVDRELCIISCLMIEDREKQLYSHVRGAVNLGVSKKLLRLVVDDLGQAAGQGYRTAQRILSKLSRQ